MQCVRGWQSHLAGGVEGDGQVFLPEPHRLAQLAPVEGAALHCRDALQGDVARVHHRHHALGQRYTPPDGGASGMGSNPNAGINYHQATVESWPCLHVGHSEVIVAVPICAKKYIRYGATTFMGCILSWKLRSRVQQLLSDRGVVSLATPKSTTPESSLSALAALQLLHKFDGLQGAGRKFRGKNLLAQ